MMPGSTKEDVAKRLEAKGLTVSELTVAPSSDDFVTPTAEPKNFVADLGHAARDAVKDATSGVKLQDLHFMFRQLAAMLHAGISVSQALGTIGKQIRNFTVAAAIGTLSLSGCGVLMSVSPGGAADATFSAEVVTLSESVIIKARTLDAAIAAVESVDGRIPHRLGIINAVGAVLTPDQIKRVRNAVW